MELIVSNIPSDMQEDELWDLFEAHGKVEYVDIVRDEATNLSRGFGFVGMNDEEEALSAITALHKSKYKGCVLKVKESFDTEDDKQGKYYRKQLRRKDRQGYDNLALEELE